MKAVIAETMIMKQQLIVMNRGRARAPKLGTSDRFLFGLLAHFIHERRLHKVAVIIRPATIFSFHKALVKRKYSRLYSNKTKKKLGGKGQDQALIDIVIEMKARNPSFGYGRIATQIFEAFGIEISLWHRTPYQCTPRMTWANSFWASSRREEGRFAFSLAASSSLRPRAAAESGNRS